MQNFVKQSVKTASKVCTEYLPLSAAAPTSSRNSVHTAASWVFLGPPGVGKGTYSTRVADALGVPHISAGDLVRNEIKNGTKCGVKMASIVNSGNLLPDSIVLELLRQRLEEGKARGEEGFLLDGFPRTKAQAVSLSSFTDVQLAVNLSVRKEVLIAKCLGRRVCGKCGKNFNIADIHLPASSGRPAICMPPLQPPQECVKYLETRADDTLEVVQQRLRVYQDEAAPVEAYFRQQGVLLDFEITGGIPETLPRLIAALQPHSHLLDVQHAQAA